MEIKINRDTGIPIYIQIKKQIKEMIDKGILSKGDRLVPERELAEKLKVSRNRVSTAYNDLENEGIIYSQQGKGTFIAGKISGIKEASRKDKLLKIIDLAMEEAIEMGFSLDDFLTIAYVRAKEKKDLFSKTKVAFIECNEEQLMSLIEEAKFDHKIASIPILTEEMKNEAERVRNVLSKVKIIITTSFHIEEVEAFITGMDKNIVNLSLEPKMETIVKLARIEEDREVGLICQSENFALEVEKSIEKLGLDNFNLEYTIAEDDELENFIEKKDFLISSPHRYKELLSLSNEKKVFEFKYAPDQGSINMLKMALLNLQTED